MARLDLPDVYRDEDYSESHQMTVDEVIALDTQDRVSSAFWRYVSKGESYEDCWGWSGPCHDQGYSKFSVLGRQMYAHRVSYQIHKGEIPADLVIDHLCRNRSCTNPSHLEPVTRAENARRGSRSKLSFAAAAEIREKLEGPLRELCEKYGVGYRAVFEAAVGNSWVAETVYDCIAVAEIGSEAWIKQQVVAGKGTDEVDR